MQRLPLHRRDGMLVENMNSEWSSIRRAADGMSVEK